MTSLSVMFLICADETFMDYFLEYKVELCRGFSKAIQICCSISLSEFSCQKSVSNEETGESGESLSFKNSFKCRVYLSIKTTAVYIGKREDWTCKAKAMGEIVATGMGAEGENLT